MKDSWVVPSQSSSTKYLVRLNPISCTCQDFELRQMPCKHIHAARIVCERDYNGKHPELVVDSVPKRPTYKQNWVTYNKSQSTEKHRFQVLLRDLCRGLNEPERQGVGRLPHMVRDSIFAMVYKVYSTFSSRRFNCDLLDAYEKGYISRKIPGMKVCNFTEDPEMTPILQDLIVQSSLPLRAIETAFAPDSTGSSTCRFVKWYDEKYGVTRSGRDWVKAHAICGVKTNIVTSVEIRDEDAADCPIFRPLVETTAKNFQIHQVVADKGYLSSGNLESVHDMEAQPFIPFKVNSVAGEPGSLWEKMFLYYSFKREEFLKHYHQRSNIESTFSMINAKFRDHVRSKGDVAMKNEVLCKFLAQHICVLIQSQCELGIETLFWEWESNSQKNERIPELKLA